MKNLSVKLKGDLQLDNYEIEKEVRRLNETS